MRANVTVIVVLVCAMTLKLIRAKCYVEFCGTALKGVLLSRGRYYSVSTVYGYENRRDLI